MQKMGQNACVQISNMNENVQNVGHWRQTCMSMVMKGPGSLSAALPSFCGCYCSNKILQMEHKNEELLRSNSTRGFLDGGPLA